MQHSLERRRTKLNKFLNCIYIETFWIFQFHSFLFHAFQSWFYCTSAYLSNDIMHVSQNVLLHLIKIWIYPETLIYHITWFIKAGSNTIVHLIFLGPETWTIQKTESLYRDEILLTWSGVLIFCPWECLGLG